ARVFAARFLRICSAKRRLDARGVVDLLNEAVGADADLAARRVGVGHVAVGLDADGHAVANHDLEQAGTRHALVAIGRDPLDGAHRASASRELLASAVLLAGSPAAAPPAATPAARPTTFLCSSDSKNASMRFLIWASA